MLLRIGGLFLACLLLVACGSSEFDPVGVLESRPVKLDGEQVALDPGQVDCGTRAELWDVTLLGGDGRAVARLTKKGRDLQFSDDIQIGDPAVGVPYAQIHGTFPIKVLKMGSVRDEDEWDKVVEAKVAVAIDHACFQNNPLVLLGIKHGQFDPSANPVFRVKLDRYWLVDQTIH